MQTLVCFWVAKIDMGRNSLGWRHFFALARHIRKNTPVVVARTARAPCPFTWLK